MINERHRTYLEARGVTDKNIIERRAYTSTDDGLLIPWYTLPDGLQQGYEVRLDVSKVDGRKFDRPAGQQSRLIVHPDMITAINDTSKTLMVVEGTTRVDALAERNIPSIGIAGVYNFMRDKTQLPDWDSVAVKGRNVIIGVDGDVVTNEGVNNAVHRLADLLLRKGARAIRVLTLPGSIGLDDWLGNGGDILSVHQHSVSYDELNVIKPKKRSKEERARKAVGQINDTALAEAWVDSVYAQSRYAYDTSQWASYYEGTWHISKSDAMVREQVTSLLKQHARALDEDPEAQDMLLNSNKVNSVTQAVRSNADVWVRRDEFDKDAQLFNMQNGVYDLDTHEFHEHSATHLVSMKGGAAYRPTAKAPQFDRFIRWALPDELTRRFVQKLFGQALIGRVDEQVLPIFTGSGGNGKGTLLKAIGNVFGDYWIEAKEDLLVETRQESHDEKLAIGEGKRLMTTNEPKRGKLNMERTKTLTGGDPVTASFKGQSNRTFDPTWTIVMATNTLPDFDGEDGDALRRRLRVVPFDSVATEVDVHLSTKLREEVDGIYLWLLEGLRLWRLEGLGAPDSVVAASSAAIEDGDSLTRFMSERIVWTNDPRDRLKVADLLEPYSHWAQSEYGYGGYREVVKQQITREVKQRLRDRAKMVDERAVKAVRGWVLEGAKLVTESDEDQVPSNQKVPMKVPTIQRSDLQGTNGTNEMQGSKILSEEVPGQLDLFADNNPANRWFDGTVGTDTPSDQAKQEVPSNPPKRLTLHERLAQQLVLPQCDYDAVFTHITQSDGYPGKLWPYATSKGREGFEHDFEDAPDSEGVDSSEDVG